MLEHCLNKGSKEFPECEKLCDFINNHGGYDNAFTTFESTCSYFNIDNQHLEEAMYMMSRCYKEPIFKAEWIDKEVQAIENEF